MGVRHAKDASAIAARAEQMELDLGRIRQVLRRSLDAEIAKGGLTMPQSAVMRVVVSNQGISLKNLSREINLAHSTVSGIVDRLEKRGMVERRPDPEDGRTCRLYPTTAVAAFVRERMPALARRPLKAALERAAEAEQKAISSALRRLRELLEES